MSNSHIIDQLELLHNQVWNEVATLFRELWFNNRKRCKQMRFWWQDESEVCDSLLGYQRHILKVINL